MEALSINKYIKILLNGWKIILSFVISFFILSILFCIFIYKPNYMSSSEILIKDDNQTSFVTDLNAGNGLGKTVGINKDPIATQIEIFGSIDQAKNAWDKLKNNTEFKNYNNETMPSNLKKSIKLEAPTGTDIIKLSVKWRTPEGAKKILQAFIDSFYKYNVDNNKQSVIQMKNYILKQLNNSQKELANTRSQIEKYRKSSNSIDINQESDSLISQKTEFENNIAETSSLINSEKGKINTLSKNIGVNLNQAIDSVALGQNQHIITLQQNLNEVNQKYATLGAKYPPTNPQMKALAENRNEIELQIKSQISATIGKNINDKNSRISDTVRVGIIDEIVKSEANLKALQLKKNSLQKTLSSLNNKQNLIPTKQKTLNSLLQDEKNLITVVDTLNTKLVEAKIKESEIISNINIVQNATLPQSPSFPTNIHFIFLFIIAGALLGMGTVIGIYYVENNCNGASEIEHILESPILGVIPWVSKSSYEKLNANINPASILGIIYQKIATSFKIRCLKLNKKVIGFSSVEFGKRRPIISVNVAKMLVKCGSSVLIINGDFRDNSFNKEIKIDDTKNYSDLIDVLTLISRHKADHNEGNLHDIISKAVIRAEDYPNLFILTNKSIPDNPYEVLASESFPILINKVKDMFDFVIIDTPPILAVPDSITISQILDALVIICGVKTYRPNLSKISKLCKDNYVEILGAIARDTTTELELPESQYIKQLNYNEEIVEDIIENSPKQ